MRLLIWPLRGEILITNQQLQETSPHQVFLIPCNIYPVVNTVYLKLLYLSAATLAIPNDGRSARDDAATNGGISTTYATASRR